MSTPIQIVDEQDRPAGQATKQEAWTQGLRHRVIHIMIENGQGDILLQHRLPSKELFPDCWDNSASGHVDIGEDYDTAALRELDEELGITGVQLEVLGTYPSDETWRGRRLKRFSRAYRLRYDETPTKLDESELDDVRWMPLAELRKLIQESPDEVSDGLRQVVEQYYS